MSKILAATCQDGVVSVGSLPVEGTTILSEGVAPSSGVLLLQGANKTYIPKTTPDLKSTLETIASALGDIASALSTIDAKPVGGSGSAPAPGAAGNIAAITTAQAELEELMEALK